MPGVKPVVTDSGRTTSSAPVASTRPARPSRRPWPGCPSTDSAVSGPGSGRDLHRCDRERLHGHNLLRQRSRYRRAGMTALDRALGALYGLAVGDALGMPTQLYPRDEVLARFGDLTWFVAGPHGSSDRRRATCRAGRPTTLIKRSSWRGCSSRGACTRRRGRAGRSGCSTGRSGWSRPGRPTCSGPRPPGRSRRLARRRAGCRGRAAR